ncbi:MAG: hypothetical protein FJ095_15775 [Deltaproteobacteria bacterium]|nr:hypothetical protein [Deltaproteobacteria bacterium]
MVSRWGLRRRSVLVGALAALGVASCAEVAKLDRFEFLDVCVPEALDATCKGVECGPRTNNCGEPVACPDTCSAKGNGIETCGDNTEADPNRCGCTADPNDPLKCCVPVAIEQLCFGVQCGEKLDNCGQMRLCPSNCNAPDTCGDNADNDANKCGCTAPPVAVTCSEVECGVVEDKCGLFVTCPSTCAPLHGCEVGGVGDNTCGCTGVPNATPPAPTGCEMFSGTVGSNTLGRSYYVCPAKSEVQARVFCQGFGTDLVRPKTFEQNQLVAGLVMQSTVAGGWYEPHSYWLGLEDPECGADACNYKWIDGAAVTATFYNGGEPNNTGGGEHCIEAKGYSGNWNDIPCANTRGVVCETTCD